MGANWVVRVQSVTWTAMVGCPCDRWWLVLSRSPSPLIPLPSRERGIVVGVVLLLPRPVDTALRPV